MNQNEQLIKNFYDCFAKKDWRSMLDCYHKDVFFYDPVFQNLEGAEARAMWQMLVTGAADLDVSCSHIRADEEHGECRWTARYMFTATGRRVVNECKAHFSFSGGMITEHQDEFSFWKWSRQAFGLSGWLLGGASWFQRKVRTRARKALEKFMAAAGRQPVSA